MAQHLFSIIFVATAMLVLSRGDEVFRDTRIVLLRDEPIRVSAIINHNLSEANPENDPCRKLALFVCFELANGAARSVNYSTSRSSYSAKEVRLVHDLILSICPDNAGFIVLSENDEHAIFAYNGSHSTERYYGPQGIWNMPSVTVDFHWDVRGKQMNFFNNKVNRQVFFDVAQAMHREGVVRRVDGLRKVEYFRITTGIKFVKHWDGKCNSTIQLQIPEDPLAYAHSPPLSLNEEVLAELQQVSIEPEVKSRGNEYGMQLELCDNWDYGCMIKYSVLAILYDVDPVFQEFPDLS